MKTTGETNNDVLLNPLGLETLEQSAIQGGSASGSSLHGGRLPIIDDDRHTSFNIIRRIGRGRTPLSNNSNHDRGRVQFDGFAQDRSNFSIGRSIGRGRTPLSNNSNYDRGRIGKVRTEGQNNVSILDRLRVLPTLRATSSVSSVGTSGSVGAVGSNNTNPAPMQTAPIPVVDPTLPSRFVNVTSVADSGPGSLRSAIASIPSNSRINHIIRFAPALAGRSINLLSQINIPVGSRIMVDGSAARGLIINGGGRSRLFNVRSTSVTPTFFGVKDLTLSGGYTSERGGAIASEHRANLEVQNVVFLNNVADKGGGAIFSAFEGTLLVRGSRFEGNRAIAGNDERGAGAITFWGPNGISVIRSTFLRNQGINGGAINSLNGKLLIDGCRFIENNTLAARVDTGKPNPTLRGLGGAIYTDRASSTREARGMIQILRSYFEGNSSRGEGGAAYLFNGSQDSVVIEDSSFFKNAVQPLPGGGMGDGGAVVVSANSRTQGLRIDRTSFIDNTASNQGGALWTRNAPATIVNSTFSGNRAVGGVDPARPWTANGGAMLLGGDTNIVNSTIANNHAFWVGGAVSAASGFRVSTRNSIFFRNTAANGGNNWRIQQQTNRQLINEGGNIQFPELQSTGGNRGNDFNVANGIRVADPRLSSLNRSGDRWFFSLLSDSPAINQGVSGGLTPSIDIRGGIRDARPDIGAIEALAALTGMGTMPSSSSTTLFPGQSNMNNLTNNMTKM